jgi:hypothetical protein
VISDCRRKKRIDRNVNWGKTKGDIQMQRVKINSKNRIGGDKNSESNEPHQGVSNVILNCGNGIVCSSRRS